MRTTLAALLLMSACSGSDTAPSPPADSMQPLTLTCPQAGAEAKLTFTREESCSNDGGVEFCLPDQPDARAAIAAISSAIRCSPGGGRAQCSATPGLLLCSLPTAFPDQCLTSHGAMNDATWSVTCAAAARPEVTQIVPSLAE
ncbi:MAG TPA: hypothetical protein VGM90_04075 [Kofleriaceae bacterium]|jgi:hypothetical protein